MKNEITWEELFRRLGKKFAPEKTTVTHKVRRIAEWDDELFKQSCMLNAPTEIALTFADYVDPDLANVDSKEKIMNSVKFMNFINNHNLNLDVIKYISTGPNTIVEV